MSDELEAAPSAEEPQSGEQAIIDPLTGLPLPDPFPEYLACPHCGEREVEVWCYETRVRCHNCGQWFDHVPSSMCRTGKVCQPHGHPGHPRWIAPPEEEEDPGVA
jgi:hypothetical protein